MLPKPIHLKGLTIEVPVALGPMAGVTDLPFRTLCREQGCGMFYTEMVSAQALHYRNRNAQTLLQTAEEEHPLGVQLFGSDPYVISEQAKALEERFDFIDFNMGCPVPKIVKNHEGSFLLKEQKLVREIFT
jgi:tRNA-dihydrouridine synthase